MSGDFLSPNAGEVYGQKVKLRAFEKQKKLLKLLLPIEASTLPDNVLNAETFKQIALARKAKQEGLTVSNAEVKNLIQLMLGGGQITDMRSYERWTKSVLNESPRDFEESLRQVILAEKYSNQLLENLGPQIPKPDVPLPTNKQKEIEDQNQKLKQEAILVVLKEANIKSNLKQ